MPIERIVITQVRSNCALRVSYQPKEFGHHFFPQKMNEYKRPGTKMGTDFPKYPDVFIFHQNQQQVILFLDIYHEVGWSICSKELNPLESALSKWWMEVGGQISQLPCWGNSEAYSTLCPRASQWDWVPVAQSSNLLDTVHYNLASLSCLTFTLPLLLFPRINSQINYFASNPCLRVSFWENPN